MVVILNLLDSSNKTQNTTKENIPKILLILYKIPFIRETSSILYHLHYLKASEALFVSLHQVFFAIQVQMMQKYS